MKPLIYELQRRRVPQVLGLYMAGAFAVSQGIQLLEDALQIPAWVLSVTVIVALALFPVIVVFAWVYDFGREGVVRTPAVQHGFRWSFVYGAIAFVVFVALMFGGWIALRPPPQDADRVAVLPLENRTGDAALGSLGEMAADWITESLMRAAFAEVVDLQTTLRAGIGPSQKGATLNASTLISGNYYRSGEQLIFNVRLISAEGKTIEALQPIAGPVSDPTRGLNEVRDRVVAALARTLDRRVATFDGGASSAPSYQAYEAYVEGLHIYLEGSFAGALVQFRRAFEADTTFLRAMLWAAGAASWGNTSDSAFADSAYQYLSARLDRLSPYDRHHLLFFKATVSDDHEAAYRAAQAMRKASPGSDDAVRETALAALRTGRMKEAIELLEQLDRTVSLSSEWPEYYWVLTLALDGNGEPAKALQVARAGRELLFDGFTLAALAWAAAANGNAPLAVALVDTISQLNDSPLGVMATAMRLNAAGAKREAATIFRKFTAHPTARAAAHYYLGDYDAAQGALDSLRRAIGPERFERRGFLLYEALIAARRDPARARALLAGSELLRRSPALYAVLGERDAAVQALSRRHFGPPHGMLIRYDLDLLPLAGYPPFEKAVRPRR